MSNRLKDWIKERVPTEGFNYKVPWHANTFPFTLGGITLISFVILAVSGIILAQFFSPTPDTANESIRIFMTDYKLGNFIRGIHYWTAQLAMLTVILHLLRVFFYGSYKKPREVNWIFGVLLLFGMIGLYYTGTILKWDQEAFEALEHSQVGANIVGGFIANYLAENTSVTLLAKFFSLHTSVLPLLVVTIIVVHLMMVKSLGISSLPFKSKKAYSESTFLVHFKHLTAYALIMVGVVFILAILIPPAIGSVPVAGIEATKPPWIFMSIFSIENWFGLGGLVIITSLLAVLLLLVPFIDRKKSADLKSRKGIISVGALAVILFIGLTVNAYITDPEQHIGMGEEEPQQNEEEEEIADNDDQTDEEIQDEIENELIEESTVDEESTELKALNQALAIIIEIDQILDEEGDFQLAGERAAELDEVIDAIGDEIKAKDATLRQELGKIIHELEELQEATNPNLSKASNEAHEAEEKIKEAIELFEESTKNEESTELKALNQALAIIIEIDQILDEDGDFQLAGERAAELDEVIDAIGDEIKAKDATLRQELGEIIHELEELQEATNPDFSKASNEAHEAEEKIKEAIELFK